MDELQKYYEHLKSQGAELPDYDSFKFTLEDEGSRREFYDYAKEQKYDVPEDYDTFSYTLFPPQGEVDPSKKKEETELAGVSPSPLQSGDSDSIKFPDPMAGSPGAMSEEQFTKQSLPAPPTTKLQDDFDPPGLREAADPVTKMLWNSLLKSGKPTEEQQAEIEKSTKYPPTLWNVFTSTLLSSGPGINRIPTVTYKTGEKKASDYERRNQQDFIEDMTPQGKAQLLNEAKESGYALNQKNLDIYRDLKFLETQMIEVEKGIEGFKDLDPNTFTPEQLKAAQTLVTLAETVPMMYNSKVDEYNSNLDDLKTFTKEIDLLKRQYGFVDNFVGNVVNMSRMLFAGAEETLGAVVEEGAILAGNAMAPASEFLTENVAGAVAQGGKKIREQASKDFFEAANAQMNYGIPRKGIDDLTDAEDVGEWMAQEVATQVPIITTIMLTQGAFSAPGVGASLIGGMTGGQKSIELREEGKYTKMQILFASLGHGAAETIGELGTEFVVMKGARALGAAKRSGEFARVRSGYKEYVKKLLTNAGYGATEAPAEVFTQLMQNAIDINLGKNISIWDGVKDAGASGLLLGEGMTVLPTVVGQALQTFQEPSKIEKLKINSKQMLDLELQIAKGEKGPEIIKKYQELSDNLRKESQEILDEAIEIANYSTEQERKTLTKAEAKVKETREILDNAKQDPEIPAKVIESLAKDHQKAIERRGDALNDAVLSTKARLDEITKEKPFKDELDNKLYRDIRMTMAQDPVEAQATTTVYSATLNTMAARAGVSREQMQDLVSFRRGLPTDQSGTLFQRDAAPYKSTAVDGLEKIQPNTKMTPDQWVKMIADKGGKGTTQDLEAIGLKDFLDNYLAENNVKSVPKDVVEQFVVENQVEIEEVSKGKKGSVKEIFGIELSEMTEAQRFVAQADIDDGALVDTKYGSYTLEGGENYREVLLMLPVKESNFTARLAEGSSYYKWDVFDELGNLLGSSSKNLEKDAIAEVADRSKFKSGHWDEANIVVHIRINERTLPNGERVLFVEEIQSDWAQEGKKSGFISKENEQRKDEIRKALKEAEAAAIESFKFERKITDQAFSKIKTMTNAGARYFAAGLTFSFTDGDIKLYAPTNKLGLEFGEVGNYRVYKDPKDDLYFISDTGKPKGGNRYSTRQMAHDQLEKQIQTRNPFSKKEFDKSLLNEKEREAHDWLKKNYYEEKESIEKPIKDALEKGLIKYGDQEGEFIGKYPENMGDTPNMPYKKTDQWVGLAFRRVMQMAANEGFDRVAWVTGEQSADRYNLSKQVDKIDVFTNDNGTYEIHAGTQEIKNVSKEKIEDYVGKDLASQILEDEKTHKHEPGGENLIKTYRGQDLKVGGEGMKAFYNNILPKVAKKEAQRFDKASKVEVVDFTPSIGNYTIAFDKEYDWWVVKDKDGKKATEGVFAYEDNARYVAEQLNAGISQENIESSRPKTANQAAKKQLSIPITDKARQALKQPIPLFQDARGAMTPTDAGFVVSALTDPNMSTPVHELAHIYEYFMTDQERNSVLKWAKHDTWTVDTSEAFARGFEKYLSQGKAPSTKLETVFEQFKNWLTDIYDGIKGSEIDLKLSPAMEKIYSDMLTHTEQSNEQLAEKKNILQQFSSENLSNLSEDDEGNFVFFHVSDKKIAQIDPSKMGTNKATSRQEAAEIAMSGTSVSFFYTTEDQGESMVSGANKYAVSVKKEEVYDYNMDPKNYKEKAKKEYKKKNPGKGFSENTMLGAVAGLAQKDGYKIIIHEWDPNGQGVVSRAISPIKLKPTDSEQYKGNVIAKSFDKNYVNAVNKSLLTQAVFEYRQAKRELVNKYKAKKISDKAFAKQKKELNKELGRKEKETGLVPLQVGIVPRTEAWNDGVKQALPNSPYTKEDLQQLLDDSEADFAILTAENPNNVVPTDVVNERLNEEARTWLEGEGLTPIEVFGKYATSENSFFVPDMTLDQALSFAQIFNQEAVAHNKGFVYQDGSVTRRKEGFREYAKQKPTADYSTIKTSEGELYSFELYYDWGGEKFNLTDNTDKAAIAKAQVNLEEVMKKVEASQGDVLFQKDRVSIPRDIAKQVVKKMMEATRSAENIGEITRIGSDELRATPWFQQLSEENQDGALLAVRRMTGIDELPIVDEGPTLADAVFGPLKVRVPSVISNDPLSLGGPLSEKSRNIQKNFIDKYHWLRTLQRNLARERGETIPPEQDFSRTEDLTHGRTEYRVGLFNERMKGIMKKMIDAGVRKEDVDAYMLAKHAPIRNKYIREVKGEEKKYSGVTDAWAHRMMRELRQDPKFNDIKEIAKDFYDIIEDTKKNYLEYGLENQEAIDDIEAMDFYVPMRGFAAEGLDNGLGMDASGSLPIRGRENKGLKGRTTLPDSPISNIEAQHINSITRGERNKVMNTLYELAKAHPDESLWEIYNNPGGPLLNSILKDQASNKESPYVSLKVDGKQVYIKFAAPRLAVTLRKLDVQKVPKLFQAATTMNRWLSNVFTQWNPDFMVGNFARDIQTAITNILSEVETSTGSANIENWRTNLSSEAEQARLIKDVVKDTFLSIGTIAQVLRGVEVKNKRLEKYFREFREDGGQTAWYYPKGVDGLKKSFDKQFAILAKERNALEKSGDYVQALGKLLEDTNSAIENGVRLATYVQLRKRGATRFDAADVAKNLTVNFNRSGEYGTLMNSLYLFFNASVQGSARMARAVFTMKKVFNENTNEYNYKMSSAQKLIAGMTMMNFILALFNRSWSGEDEDGVLYYDKIPQYEKERNIIIMLPEDEKGDYIKIPMPYGYSIFANLGTVLADTSTGPMTKGEALDFMLGSMLNSFMPVNFGESDEFFKGVAKNAIPTVFKPIIELAINENYFGAPIYNEDFDGAIATPEATKGRRNTPAAFKEFSLLLNEVSGGTENIPGKIDINPEVLHYLFDYYLGGTGRTVTNLAEVSASSWDKYVGGQEVDVKQSRIPILRRFYGEQVRHLNDGNYFARKEKVGQWFNEYKKGEGRKVPIPPKDVQFLYDRAKAVDRRLKILRKDRDKIYKMPNGKEKAKWQNKWDKEYFKVIAQFNKEWEKRVESAK